MFKCNDESRGVQLIKPLVSTCFFWTQGTVPVPKGLKGYQEEIYTGVVKVNKIH